MGVIFFIMIFKHTINLSYNINEEVFKIVTIQIREYIIDVVCATANPVGKRFVEIKLV